MWTSPSPDEIDREDQPLTKRGYMEGRKRQTIIFAIVAWNLILFLLAVIALSKTQKIENNQYNTNTVSYQLGANLTIGTAAKSLPSEIAVSLQTDGTLTIGGGSTIYQNVATIQQTTGAQLVTSLFSLPLSSTKILISYQVSGSSDESANGCFLLIGTASFDDISIDFEPSTQISICPTSIISLSKSLFVGQRNGIFLTFTIDDKDHITPGINQTFSEMGLDSLIAPLSSDSFAISYYSGSTSNLTTSVAQVTNTSITLLATLEYSPDRVTHELISLTPSSYLICYPLTSGAYPDILPGPLACSLFSWNGTNIMILVSESTYSSSSTSLFFGLTTLSPSTAALVWVDQGRNNRLQAVVILIQQDGNPSISFGSDIILNSGDASGTLPNFDFPEIIAQTLTTEEFVVLYSDFANGGRVTLNLVGLNPEDQLFSPGTSFNMVTLSTAPNVDELGYYWLSLSALSTTQYLVIDSLTNGSSSSSSSSSSVGGIHFAEIMNRPLGLTSTKQEDNGVADVTVGGIATLSETKLVAGMTYYATTKGTLEQGPIFGSRKVSAQGFYQVDNTLMSADSCLGTALDEHSLLLHSC